MATSGNKNNFRWIAFGVLGASLPFVGYGIWTKTHQDAELTALANTLNYDPANYVKTRKLADAVAADKPISDEDWRDLARFCDDKNPAFRARNLALLDHMKNTLHKDEALAISMKYIDDKDEGVQTIAMDNIKRLGAPNWEDIMKSKLTSTSPLVKQRAEKLLGQKS